MGKTGLFDVSPLFISRRTVGQSVESFAQVFFVFLVLPKGGAHDEWGIYSLVYGETDKWIYARK